MTKKVLITAAAGGIGKAIAHSFIDDGDKVYICDINIAAVDEMINSNANLSGCVADLSKKEDIEKFINQGIEFLGGVDVLINNAGVAGQRGPVEELDYESWDSAFKVNIHAVFYAIKLVSPIMKEQKSGCIINTSTMSSKVGLPNRLPYVASKAAVNGLTYNIARELGPFNIRCNAILPGAVNNERGMGVVAKVAEEKGIPVEEFLKEALQYISMRTAVEPEEIADLAVFLASKKAKHISGQLIAVDGNVEWEE